jgi:hypothetical protein
VITRLLAFVLLLYVLGYALFAVQLPKAVTIANGRDRCSDRRRQAA